MPTPPPPVGLRFANPIYGIPSCVGQRQDRGDAAGGVDEVLYFFQGQRAGEDVAFAVRRPLLQDSVAVEFAGPHRRRHVVPISAVVQVDVACGTLPGDDGPQFDPAVADKLFDLCRRRGRDDAVPHNTTLWRWLWGDGYPFEEAWVTQRVAFAYDRAYRPAGVARQMLAVLETEGLWEAQTDIRCPTLVIHGEQDPCFSGDHGRAIAERIPGAQLWLDPRMGHTLHREQWREMAERVAALAP